MLEHGDIIMADRQGVVTFKGNGVTLTGREVKVGNKAPDFTALDQNLQPVRLSDFKGQSVLISVVPSLDTGICEMQTRRFNEEAARTGARILTISMDLPFAQKRFCGTHNITAVTVLSDYKDREFGRKYGVLVKELGLLARAIFVIGPDGRVKYREIVSEIASHPDYEKALAALG
ncbi:MAG: thiol peroxidase [Candidatus Sumerlaeia bacterium]